jgi:alkyl sulfatase BDS1-like metallo-beta-lactamase superfamily hydrolase
LSNVIASGNESSAYTSFDEFIQLFGEAEVYLASHHWPSNPDTEADATLNLTHGMLIQMLTGKAGLKDILLSDELELEGSQLDLVKFFSLFDKPGGRFDIVTP